MEGCPHIHCYAPDASCALGHMEYARCPEWTGLHAETVQGEAGEGEILLPWTGSALGLTDLSFVTGRAKPTIVGVAGPESAGKTTLLAAWYLLLGRGLMGPAGKSFAGSFSLSGWEAIASSLKWEPGQPPAFPQHTTSGGARAPGLLHLSFRGDRDRLSDYLFADAPGEWFQRWAVNAGAADAEGARWVDAHCDVMLLVADRHALSGPALGAARNAFQLLATRVAAEARGRPVALVWTKADVAVDPEMEERITSAVKALIPDAPVFSVTVFSDTEPNVGSGLQALFDWILQTRRPGVSLPPAYNSGVDPLFVFGRRTS